MHIGSWPPVRFSAPKCGSAEQVTTDSAGHSLPHRGIHCVHSPFKDEWQTALVKEPGRTAQ